MSDIISKVETGIELVFFKNGEYLFRAHKNALNNVLGDITDGLKITSQPVILQDFLVKDGKEKIMTYSALEIIATDTINHTVNRLIAHTLH